MKRICGGMKNLSLIKRSPQGPTDIASWLQLCHILFPFAMLHHRDPAHAIVLSDARIESASGAAANVGTGNGIPG